MDEQSASNIVRDRLLSIGHSDLPFPRFVQLLQMAGATAVIDVRSQPFSGQWPWYNRPNLEQGLSEHSIRYFFMGDSLGGRPQQANLYDPEGRADYERMKATTTFQEGLRRLAQTLEGSKAAMLCSEEDPIDCHRGLLIAPAMKEHGLATTHIRADGSLETQSVFEARLIGVTGVGAGILDGLFAASLSAEDRSQVLADAYRMQARRKAFRLRPQAISDSPGGWNDEVSCE